MINMNLVILTIACALCLASCGSPTPVSVAGSKGTTLFFPVVGD